MSYREAIEILSSMFTGLDEETIKSVLYMNSKNKIQNFEKIIIIILNKKGGKLETTIESLLTLCDENPGGGENE